MLLTVCAQNARVKCLEYCAQYVYLQKKGMSSNKRRVVFYASEDMYSRLDSVWRKYGEVSSRGNKEPMSSFILRLLDFGLDEMTREKTGEGLLVSRRDSGFDF